MMARSDEAERYRRAAHAAIDQLDWCIEFLRRLRKTAISKQLAENRSAIAARLPPREDDRRSPASR